MANNYHQIRDGVEVLGPGIFDGDVTSPNITAHIGAGGAAHSIATSVAAGFMSSAMYDKLDGIAANANNYEWPGLTGNVTTAAGGYVTTIGAGVIVNSMISASAAIATSKLADGSLFLKTTGGTMSAELSMGGFRLTNLAEPVSSTDAATRGYVDSVAAGLSVKSAVRVATTTNIALSGLITIDDVTVDAGDRVLVKAQSTASQNGIYVAASGAWTRAADADTDAEVRSGMYCFVTEGASLAKTGWILTTPNPITVGTTNLVFDQFSAAGQVVNGDGLNMVGNVLSVKTANSARISVSASGVDISASYVGQSSITTLGTITTGVWNGTVVGARYGGTGIGAYTVGDILYASGAEALSALPAVAANNVLLSGGVGAAPSWGKVGLTTHVSGALPIANGGTGQTTKATAYDALSPNTTAGDFSYRGASNNIRLAGNTTATKMFLSMTSSVPSWTALTRSDVGLSNVENTALSSWPGTANIVTLGTITTGTWRGTAVEPVYGGTGLTSAPAAGQLMIGNSSNGYTLAALTQGVGIRVTSASGSIIIDNAGVLSVNGSTGAITNVAITGSTKLNAFASTTAAELASVINGTTGTGSLVFAVSPTLTTPILGVATATSINKVTITQPTNAATITIANNGTLATSGAGYSITLTATGNTNVTLPLSGTLMNNVLNNGYIFVGNSSNVATGVAVSGDVTMSNTGVITLVNSGVVAGTYSNTGVSVHPFTVDAKGRITNVGAAVTITPAWASITSKPTTLAGYGITDAYTQLEVLTLVAAKVSKSGDTMSGHLIMGSGAQFRANDIMFQTSDSALGFTTYAVSKQHSGTNPEILFSVSLNNIKAFVFDYSVSSSSFGNIRTGTVMIASDLSNIASSEVSTSDLGDTSGYLFRFAISGGNIIVHGTAPASGWRFRAQVRTV